MTGRIYILLMFLWQTSVSAETVRVLNWWDYLDKRILLKLEKLGEKIQVVEYRSNEVALSKLAIKTHGFDIIVVSNSILPVLFQSKLIDDVSLRKLQMKRVDNYHTDIVVKNNCIPYLWSSTVYSYDSRFVKETPASLFHLVKLKENGIRIGVIDDQLEVATRLLLDNVKSCGKTNPLKNCVSLLSHNRNFLKKEDFASSIENIIKKGNFATYGWQGASASGNVSVPWLTFAAAKHHPVVGIDYVCITSNTKQKKSRLIRIVEAITDRESIEWNMEKTQYFSPYLNHTKGLHPKVIKLYREILKSVQDSSAVEIRPPGNEELKVLNKWWQSLRYE